MRELKISQSITNRETQSLEAYFREVGKVDLLTVQEEVSLAQKIRQGDRAALERLVRANLRFVISVAKKYQHKGLSLADLVSEGNLGLIKAAERFDETRGFKFISFAVWWIRQNILSALSEQRRTIRLPMNHLHLLGKISSTSEELECRLERQPTDLELADALEIDVARIDDARYYAGRTASLDAAVGTEDEYCLLDMLTNGENEVDHALLAESERQQIMSMLRVLTSRERTVMMLTFGLEDGQEMIPREVGAILGISTERVRQVKMEALKKLKEQAAQALLRITYPGLKIP